MLGQGVYGATDALRLINFKSNSASNEGRRVSRQTVTRWLRGYDFEVHGEMHHSAPLWTPDYANDEEPMELSFRDLIELRFVKAFRDAGVGLGTIRRCFDRAVELVDDDRPFSTKRFQTDGRTIFLEIKEGVQDSSLVDLRQRQSAFQSFVSPGFHDLEFDPEIVARWFPLRARRTIVIDPNFAFGRPVSSHGHVPTEVLANAVNVEGSVERAARSYDVPVSGVKDAVEFELKLAA